MSGSGGEEISRLMSNSKHKMVEYFSTQSTETPRILGPGAAHFPGRHAAGAFRSHLAETREMMPRATKNPLISATRGQYTHVGSFRRATAAS